VKTTPENSRELTEGIARILSGPKAWNRLTVQPKFPKNSFQVFEDTEPGEWDYSALLSQPKFDEVRAEQLAARCALKPSAKKAGLQLKATFGPLSKLGTITKETGNAKQ